MEIVEDLAELAVSIKARASKATDACRQISDCPAHTVVAQLEMALNKHASPVNSYARLQRT